MEIGMKYLMAFILVATLFLSGCVHPEVSIPSKEWSFVTEVGSFLGHRAIVDSDWGTMVFDRDQLDEIGAGIGDRVEIFLNVGTNWREVDPININPVKIRLESRME